MVTRTQTVQVDLAPRWMVRENTYGHRVLRHDDGAELDRLLAGIHEEALFRLAHGEPTVQELEAVIPRLEGRARRQALAAKRAVHNASPLVPAVQTDVLDAAPRLKEWVESIARSDDLATAVDEIEHRDLVSERAVLSGWACDPSVQQSIAVTSTVLLHALRRSARGGDPDRRGRKSEAALVQYFSRSTLRVSPFSRYTAVDLRVLGEACPTSGGELTSVVAVKRFLVRHAVRQALAEPANAEHVVWTMPPGARIDAGLLVFRRRRWVTPTPGARVDGFREDDVTWPVPEEWRSMLTALLTSRPGQIRELAALLTRSTPHLEETTRTGLAQLAARGILIPVAPVPEQDPEFETALLSALETWPGHRAQTLVAALRTTITSTRQFGQLDAPARTDHVAVLEGAWSAAAGTAVRAPVVEDAYRASSTTVPTPQRWREPIASLAPMLTVLDDQRLLSVALEATFVAEYGRGGVCRDIRGFATKIAGAFPLAQRLLAGDQDSAPSASVRQVLRARATAVGHLRSISREDRVEAAIDPQFLEALWDAIPDDELDRRRPVAVFGQVAADRLVVNHLYGGRLRYFSRYLRHLDPEHTHALRRHLRNEAGEALTVHMRPTLGFNANLSPLLADAELVVDDDAPHAVDTRRIDDLSIVHGPRGLRVVEHESGRVVEIIYTGFLVPHALPSTEMLLSLLAEAPFYGFGDLAADLHRRGVGARTPRIVHQGLVLFRRRWAVDPTQLTRRPEESSSAHLRRLDADRRRMGMPAQVFVRPLRGGQVTPMERAMSPKPQHHDFLSRLHASTIGRRLDDLGPTVLAEELLPEPVLGSPAAEVFFEATINGGR